MRLLKSYITWGDDSGSVEVDVLFRNDNIVYYLWLGKIHKDVIYRINKNIDNCVPTNYIDMNHFNPCHRSFIYDDEVIVVNYIFEYNNQVIYLCKDGSYFINSEIEKLKETTLTVNLDKLKEL